MLTYDLNNRGETSIYEYLYRCIRDDIRNGRLVPGTKLPSKRELAADNGVSLITVENTYAQLILEGYIEARPRKGYFVEEIALWENEEIISEAVETDVNNESDSRVNIITSNAIGYGNIAKQNSKSFPGIINSETFPYVTWSKLMRKVLNDRERDFEIAPPSEGVYELRKAIADYLLNAKNLCVNPNCIVVGPGTEYLHSILIQLIGRNRLVAVEDPGYLKAAQIYESNGMKVIHVPIDDEGIDVTKLEGSGIRLVHCAPAHHFPTGTVMSASRRHSLLKWAGDQGAYIIEDDYDSEFRFKGLPLPTLMSLDKEKVIYMNTFTGTLAPSIRIAYMVLPEKLMKVYKEKLFFMSGTVSTFDQLTLAEFICEGYYERHISRMRNKYRKIRNLYKEALKESKLGEVASIDDDPAGLSMIIEINGDNSVFTRQEEKKKIIDIIPMSRYCYYRLDKYKSKYLMRYVDIDKDSLIEHFNHMV